MKVLVVPPKTVTAKDKQDAQKHGFLVIECSDPSKIVVIDEHQIISGNDLAMIALETLVSSAGQSERSAFTIKLYNKLKSKQNVPES